MQISMRNKGDWWDHAPIESYIGKLKTCCLHHYRVKTRAEAKRITFDYMLKCFTTVFASMQGLKNQIPDEFANTYIVKLQKNAA